MPRGSTIGQQVLSLRDDKALGRRCVRACVRLCVSQQAVLHRKPRTSMGAERFSLTASDSQSREPHSEVAGQGALPAPLLLLLKFPCEVVFFFLLLLLLPPPRACAATWFKNNLAVLLWRAIAQVRALNGGNNYTVLRPPFSATVTRFRRAPMSERLRRRRLVKWLSFT